MNDWGDTILSIVVLGGILVGSAILTNLFVNKMYFKCSRCATLNAKRRSNCRNCGNRLNIDPAL
jgi:hypothetical protein